jgi:hypothetical protein
MLREAVERVGSTGRPVGTPRFLARTPFVWANIELMSQASASELLLGC